MLEDLRRSELPCNINQGVNLTYISRALGSVLGFRVELPQFVLLKGLWFADLRY